MSLERISLFSSKKEFLSFLLFCAFIFSYALLIEYNNYKNLTKFKTSLITATVLKQYTKSTRSKKGKLKYFQIVKLKSSNGLSFYTKQKESFPQSQGKKIKLEIWASKISFYEYMTSFFAYSKILPSQDTSSIKYMLNAYLTLSHSDEYVSSIYKALYTATALPSVLQEKFSLLGISHLLAISGFHLGVLSALLFFLFKSPYKYFQNRYLPYRSYKVDSFFIISLLLFSYLLFLDIPPSLLRAFVMLLVGFILYDRGFKLLSMQTLLLTVMLIISFSPRLFFSLGFWLSVWGVFYIFLFLIHFKDLHKFLQFVFVPIWVYLMMLPLSLFIFESFSIYHPLSILWTSLFTLFYPLSICLHCIVFGSLLDNSLIWMLSIDLEKSRITLHIGVLLLFSSLSLFSVWKKSLVYLLFIFAFFIFVYAIYNVT